MEVTLYGTIDIVAGRYDVGVRLGDEVAKYMIAIRIAPDLRMVMVARPTISEAAPPRKRLTTCLPTNASSWGSPRTAGYMPRSSTRMDSA